MISSPRLLDYELMVLDFAISLLEHYGKTELFIRATFQEDRTRYQAVQDYRVKTILQYNIQRKYIYHMHHKLLKVMRGILERISNGMEYSQACFKRVEGVEDADSEWEMYRRRMGLRHYFKELKMNMARIKRAKEAREAPASVKKPTKKKTEDTLNVASESALGKSGEKKPKKPEGKVVGVKKATTAAPVKKKLVVKK